ncbi:NarK family nitrate/nitrite MFS transporter [Luteolibacter pohnpeiensis]|uniref:Nitrate/nitrite transporter n=1 Tax=Luteolibacter pohnpeiensis TaxID=454153 RepID=A0A934SAD3_9BACT|nr:NarK family nitrate/nitrite MFS transporter [Luteolibacter pohnpeiensis]MBK1883816.1 NarK family nitrate/nitrite MFS transporter [Luteolibacter pohnpeiensis]
MSISPDGKLDVLALKSPSIRTLHITWIAFFMTFVLWFAHAPFKGAISSAFNLTGAQWKALLILNLALTIPARIVIGILVDKFGPRLTYSLLLMISGLFCVGFALSTSFQMLALMRFLMGFAGAGFVIGIRLVGEWFPARQVGLAEGIYGGWGNFGSAAAAMVLPSLALAFGGDDGWRYAFISVGCISFVYGIIFYKTIQNTPKGSTYFKPKKSGGLEVSSPRDFYFLLMMNLPMFAALGVLAWKLSPSGVNLLSAGLVQLIYGLLIVLFIFQTWQIYRVNAPMLKAGKVPEHQRYPFRQVAILDINYLITFGSELAVVSMLPSFFGETFGLSTVKAGFLASGFAFMNLAARPGGGWISDKFGRRKTMLILLAGLALGYLALSQIDSSWPVALAVIATMACSFFVQAGEGAVFAMVPLIQRRMTGQIAGMTGAYGNVGGVIFLTVYSFVSTPTFFMIIAASSIVGLVASCFLKEPQGHISEVAEDGSVQLIEVS